MAMIDISGKARTSRIARAGALVKMSQGLVRKIKENDIPKGNVLECARIAGILAAKKTADLVPLCHNIEIESVELNFKFEKNGIRIESLARATAKTGVEMEAIIACSLAAITIYDMCKMFSKVIEIQDIYLLEKRGGKSGVYER